MRKIKEDRKRRRAYLQQLESAITDWGKTKHLWAFFQEVKDSLEKLPLEEQVVVKDRLAAARSFLGESNTLKSKSSHSSSLRYALAWKGYFFGGREL